MTTYWAGNCAKHRAVHRIVNDAQGKDEFVVFDYGCGDGGDWPRVLHDHPNIRLVGYEPDPTAAGKATERLAGSNAVITTGDPPSESVEADTIVSFSVLEHVVDVPAYLANAHAQLSPTGSFVLNYDDGHFRNALPLENPRAWTEPLRATVRHRIAPVRRAAGRHSSYVKQIPYGELRGLAEAAGFVVQDDRMENLPDYKGLSKKIPSDLAEEFMAAWVAAEDALNQEFAGVVDGDGVPVLWSRMLSRTLVLAR